MHDVESVKWRQVRLRRVADWITDGFNLAQTSQDGVLEGFQRLTTWAQIFLYKLKEVLVEDVVEVIDAQQVSFVGSISGDDTRGGRYCRAPCYPVPFLREELHD